MPGQQEQQAAQEYWQRELIRPKTNIASIIKRLIFLEIIAVIMAVLGWFVIRWLGIFSNHQPAFMSLFEIVSTLVFIITVRKTLILIVEAYQHYAPEDMRRRCVMVPSCSEYAILAIRRYGVIAGCHKTYIRLTKRCKGGLFEIDYP